MVRFNFVAEVEFYSGFEKIFHFFKSAINIIFLYRLNFYDW